MEPITKIEAFNMLGIRSFKTDSFTKLDVKQDREIWEAQCRARGWKKTKATGPKTALTS